MFIKPKKSLGQNFLIDREVLEKINDTVEITNKEVLEIGPGSGNLTTFILKKKPKKVLVLKRMMQLALLLEDKFTDEITIINDDVLKISEEKITEMNNLSLVIYLIIFLLKFYLNGFLILDQNFWFESLVLMFQKEVADRIIAESNTSKYGRLSILSNWKLNIKKIIDIKPESFSPRPKIDSTLLLFTPERKP